MKVTEAQLVRSLCLDSFADFVREWWDSIPGNGRLIWSWYMQVVCDELQRVAEAVMADEAKPHDLIVNLPTGTGKSAITSVLFPAWVWAKWPHASICGASYSEELALALSLKCRDVVKSEKYQAVFPHVKIRADQDTKHSFMTTKGGVRYAVGANGTVHGTHYHLVIIDDPIDPNRTVSEAVLAAVNYWIRHTLSGRMKDQRFSVTILVMQRLHVNDPTADMLRYAEQVRHVRIPASTDYPVNPPEYSAHYKGGLMDPVRLPRTVLERRKKILGAEGYAGQYGQAPVSAEGGKFKSAMLRYAPPPEAHEFKRLVRAWDKAVTPEKGGRVARGPAYTCGVLVGMDLNNREWILDVKRKRMDSFEREKTIHRTALYDAQIYGGRVIVAVEQEPGGSGKDAAEATARRLAAFKVILSPASGSKENRADEFSFAVNAGLVYLPERFRVGNAWVDWAFEFVEEMTYWPQTTYLDQIDAAALAHRWAVRGKVRVGGPPSRKSDPTPEVFRNNSGNVVSAEQFTNPV